MWFRKKPPAADTVPYPGLPLSLDGHAALAAVERRASDYVTIRAVPLLAGLQETLHKDSGPGGRSLLIRETETPRELAALATGAALTGLRSTLITDSLNGLLEGLYAMAGSRLSCLIHLTARALARQAGSLHGGHDEYHAVAGAGLLQLFASNAQEVVDFNLIARRVTEQALTPGLCAQDLYDTSHAIQSLRLPEPGLIDRYLGHPADTITCPTPAQSLIYGEQRRRIPILLDPDHPAGIGAVQDRESFFRAIAAQRPFFYAHIPALLEAAMAEYASLTGRLYTPVSGYLTDDAEWVVIAQGAIVEELAAAATVLRERDRIRAGVVNLSLLRPFPGPQLCRLLQGKKAVTVLERTDQPLAEDLPLMREVRAALDKAMENGRARGTVLPYPAYPGFRQLNDRPVLHSGSYGVGSDLPGQADLSAVFRNMRDGARAKKSYYLGRFFTEPDRRYPHLQTLQQKLRRHYPDLERLALAGDVTAPVHSGDYTSAAIHFLAGQRGLFAVNTFAQALAEITHREVRTYPQASLEQTLQPAAVTLVSAAGGMVLTGKPPVHAQVFTASYQLVEDPALLAGLQAGGTLVLASNRTPEALRTDLSRRARQVIRDHKIKVQVLNARRIAADTSSNPAFIDHLMVWALLGAYLSLDPNLTTTDQQAVRERLTQKFHDTFGNKHPRRGEITQTMTRAAGELILLPDEFWEFGDASGQPEPEPPWTVRQARADSEHVFDVTRFWHSVGYLYDSGQAAQTLSDPYLATGIVPAASSAFRDVTPYRLRLPRWLPENCTGCGLCWSACPESALPPVVQDLTTIMQTAIRACESQGHKFIQLQRIADPLCKQAYRLYTRDDLGQYLTMGALLQDAYSQTTAPLQLDTEKLGKLTAEFDQLRSRLEHLPVARTETFFKQPHARLKNSGMPLSIVLNPAACTGCGICIAVCPDDAFTWTEQTAEHNAVLEQNWQVQASIPDLSHERVESLIDPHQAESSMNRLLLRQAYHTMLGGDGSKTSNGAKTSVHLLTAAAEAVMQRRYQQHCQKMQGQIAELEATIQGDVTRTLNINDFEDFTRRLTRLEGGQLSAERLAEMIRDRQNPAAIDPEKLRRQSELIMQLRQQLTRYEQGASGGGRARMMLVMDPGAASGGGHIYPYNPHSQPWICYPPGNVTGLAQGLISGLRRSLLAEINQCRAAALELSGADFRRHGDRLATAVDGSDFTTAESELLPPVFVICQTGGDLRRDLNRLSPGGYPVKLILINQNGPALEYAGGNNCYPEMLALAQAGVLIAQCSIGHPGDLIRAVTEMVDHTGPALLHVYAPDPESSGIAQDQIISQAALACRSRSFPLFRIQPRDQNPVLSLDANPDADRDWTAQTLTVREASGQVTTLTAPLTLADWAIRETRYQAHFDIQPKGRVNEELIPLLDYLALDPAARETLQPYIDFISDKQQHFIAVVSRTMAAACAATLADWRLLQGESHSGSPMPVTATTASAPVVTVPLSAAADLSTYQQLTDRLLELCGYKQDPDYFQQSLREFMLKDKTAATTNTNSTDVGRVESSEARHD